MNNPPKSLLDKDTGISFRSPALLTGWLSQKRSRTLFAAAYVVAFLITATAIWLVAVAPGASGSAEEGGARAVAGHAVLYILIGNLLLIAGLAVVVGRRVQLLVRNRGDAGARLHLRFVTLFSLVAVVPAILIALVFGVLVNRGVDQWFSDNVTTAVQNGAVIGNAYIKDVATEMDSDMVTIAEQLQGARSFYDNRIQFSDALVQIGELFGYPAIYILNGDGDVLASGETSRAPPYLAPPRIVLEAAAQGGPPQQQVTENPDVVRSLHALPNYGDAYLYLVRPLHHAAL